MHMHDRSTRASGDQADFDLAQLRVQAHHAHVQPLADFNRLRSPLPPGPSPTTESGEKCSAADWKLQNAN